MIFAGPGGESLIMPKDVTAQLAADSSLSVLRVNNGRFLARVSDVRGRNCTYEIVARILDGAGGPAAAVPSSKPN